MNLEQYFAMLQKMAQRQKQQLDDARRQNDAYHLKYHKPENAE